MLTVAHLCADMNPASGVHAFAQGLDRHLRLLGCDSAVFADPSALPSCRVLHIHGLWRLACHRAAVWARAHRIPVVWSTHGMTAPWSFAHKRWKKLPAWLWYQRRDLASAWLLHVTSAAEAEWNARLGLGVASRLIPMGVDVPPCLPSASREDSSSFTVLFVGRLYPVKGLDNLLRSAALLPQNVRFRLVGPDEAGYQATLARMVAELGLDERVTFVGPRFGAELSTEYAHADLLVLPSHTENFGGVVADALAHGLPVLASRFTPWRELEERRCGWWRENSPAVLAETIAAAEQLPRAELRAMGVRGRALVEERYAWPSVAAAFQSVYLSAQSAVLPIFRHRFLI